MTALQIVGVFFLLFVVVLCMVAAAVEDAASRARPIRPPLHFNCRCVLSERDPNIEAADRLIAEVSKAEPDSEGRYPWDE